MNKKPLNRIQPLNLRAYQVAKQRPRVKKPLHQRSLVYSAKFLAQKDEVNGQEIMIVTAIKNQ